MPGTPVRHLPSLNRTNETLCELLSTGLVVSLNRITCEKCLEKEHELVTKKQEQLTSQIRSKAARATNTDNVIRDFSDKLQKIYDNRTAGDGTFYGVLADFLRSLEN